MVTLLPTEMWQLVIADDLRLAKKLASAIRWTRWRVMRRGIINGVVKRLSLRSFVGLRVLSLATCSVTVDVNLVLSLPFYLQSLTLPAPANGASYDMRKDSICAALPRRLQVLEFVQPGVPMHRRFFEGGHIRWCRESLEVLPRTLLHLRCECRAFCGDWERGMRWPPLLRTLWLPATFWRRQLAELPGTLSSLVILFPCTHSNRFGKSLPLRLRFLGLITVEYDKRNVLHPKMADHVAKTATVHAYTNTHTIVIRQCGDGTALSIVTPPPVQS